MYSVTIKEEKKDVYRGILKVKNHSLAWCYFEVFALIQNSSTDLLGSGWL